jgi:hypothetical protein
MPFDPTEPADVAVWRANTAAADVNLRRELAAAMEQLTTVRRTLDAFGRVLSSDMRRLTATVFELSRYAAELATLADNTPEAARKDNQ